MEYELWCGYIHSPVETLTSGVWREPVDIHDPVLRRLAELLPE